MSATTLTNTMNNHQSSLRTSASNISEAQSIGGFKVESVSMSRSSSALGGGATVLQRNNFHLKGEVSRTGVASDLAIGGRDTTGLFVVKRPNGDIAYTANGSIRQGKDGGFFLADGSAVLGWQFDNAGKLPNNTSTTSSLTPLSLKGITSKAIPTTKIGLSANLQSSADALRGAGGQISLTKHQVTSAVGAKDVIAPGDTTTGALHLGDQFNLTPSEPGNEITFEYGGIAVSKKISATNPMYGKQRADEAFTIAAAGTAHNGTNLVQGDELIITIDGGRAFAFSATTLAGAAGQRSFNSLASLATAINSTGVLRARIGDVTNDPRLYIAANDADSGLAFTQTNGANLIQTFGLDTVATNAVANTKRFATIKEFQTKIKSQPGLTASLDTSGNLDFNAAVARSTLKLGGSAQNSRSIYTVMAGPMTQNGVETTRVTQLTNVVTIQSNNHGLKAGDYVRLTGGAAPLINGTFRVQDVSVDGDAFSVGTMANLAAGDVLGGALLHGAVLAATPQTGAFKWQKVDGGAPITTTTALSAAAATIATNVGGTATIAGFAAGTFTNAWQKAVGDIVYIQGSNSIKDGYYRITAAGDATGFAVDALTGGGFGTANSDLTVAGHVAALDTGLRITKVSSPNGVGNTGLDTLPLLLTNGTKDVTIDVGAGHKHQEGDIIAFRMPATITHDNVTITKDKYYKIASKTATTITFEADGANATGANRIGFTNTMTGGGALAQVAGTVLGADAYIDYIGREYAALGVTLGTGNAPATVEQLQDGLGVTYDPSDAELNFSSGGVTERTWTMSKNVIDSQGTVHTIQMTFGKIDTNKWAVEIYSPALDDGTYEVTTANAGQLASGYIVFDTKGQLSSVDAALRNLTIEWKNGAGSSALEIDWGAIAGLGPDGKAAQSGIVQIDKANDDMGGTNNGKVPGNVNGFHFDEDGTFSATFDNGETIAVGKIALAAFTNYNGLEQKDGFLYESNDSGAVLLKQAGVGGTGNIIVGGVTSSAVDDTGEYMDVINTTQASAMTVNVAAKINSARDQLVSGLAR